MSGAMSLSEAPQGQAAAFKPRRRNELYTSVVLAGDQGQAEATEAHARLPGLRPTPQLHGVGDREGLLIPPASYEQVFGRLGTRPCIITGESGSGKSTLVRGLLSQWVGNVFCLDTTGQDYPDQRRVDLGGFFGLKWGRAGQRGEVRPRTRTWRSAGRRPPPSSLT